MVYIALYNFIHKEGSAEDIIEGDDEWQEPADANAGFVPWVAHCTPDKKISTKDKIVDAYYTERR